MLKEYDLNDVMDNQYAQIITNKGSIWVKLYPKEVANTVANFAHLAKSGFYDGIKFHRVIPGFMAQAGCPYSKDDTKGMVGTGNPGWRIKCETDAKRQIHNRGSISMAHAGRDTGGSQFFICFTPCPHLDGMHTVFGGIQRNDEESFKVLDTISKDDVIETIKIHKDR
ncbi:MAG: peptidylprolyl isomerase [Epsilonproteobacteria bacterium]|nr:peptidylprolyl isomerase [Campylobacterota bacterium]